MLVKTRILFLVTLFALGSCSYLDKKCLVSEPELTTISNGEAAIKIQTNEHCSEKDLLLTIEPIVKKWVAEQGGKGYSIKLVSTQGYNREYRVNF